MAKATVVVIDGGGRGAALVHKYSQSGRVGKIIAIPGNDLMQINSKVPVVTFQNLKTTSVHEILEICKKNKADLIDVAQDNAIEVGVADTLIENGFKVIGPSRLSGQIEWDKAWARKFMKKYKLPIPSYKVFTSKTSAQEFVKKNPKKRWFVKAAGLAEGKGALPVENLKQALGAIEQMSKFGEAGETFVIEEWLDGEEFSMFALSDGRTYQIVGSTQDHKRLYDGDHGPNTGGIGCSTPPLVVTRNIYEQGEKIIKKTINGLANEGRPYRGILYLGAIVVGNKVYVIEFNARWGDPEAEVLVPGLKNDLYELSKAVADEQLNKVKIRTDGRARVVVTGLLKPGVEPSKRELLGLENVRKIPGVIFYGTRVSSENKRYYVTSGRLFHVVGEGKTVIDARKKAYGAMKKLSIEGNNLYYRTDIGWRDVQRLKNSV